MNTNQIAKVCHEVNAAFCLAYGDTSQPAWAEAPEWQRQSVVEGVMLHQANPNASPEDSHDAWLANKARGGWVYGEVKDADAKTHPCCVPFDQLPPEQQAKDFIFRQIVHSLTSQG